jgi:hypothetical protein
VRPLVETAPHLPPAAPATAPLPEPAEIPKRDVPPPVAQPVHVPVPVARPVQRVQVPAPAQRSVELAKREKSAEAMLEDMLAPPKRDHGCGGCHAENAEVRRHPLLLAAALGQDDRVRQIVASGVAVDRPEGTKRRTALECAIQNRRVTTVELLLSLGANPNRKTSRGARPLDEATLGKIYRTLVAHGAEPAQKPGPNDTPDILGMIFTSGR